MKIFTHVWKNLYLVHSFQDLKNAALFHVRNPDAFVHCKYNVDGKFPMIVAFDGTNERVHVSIFLTDTTLSFLSLKLNEARNG